MKEEEFESIGDYVKHLEYKLKIAKLKAELTKMEDKMARHQDKKYKRGDEKLNDLNSISGMNGTNNIDNINNENDEGGEENINFADEDETNLASEYSFDDDIINGIDHKL